MVVAQQPREFGYGVVADIKQAQLRGLLGRGVGHEKDADLLQRRATGGEAVLHHPLAEGSQAMVQSSAMPWRAASAARSAFVVAGVMRSALVTGKAASASIQRVSEPSSSPARASTASRTTVP